MNKASSYAEVGGSRRPENDLAFRAAAHRCTNAIIVVCRQHSRLHYPLGSPYRSDLKHSAFILRSGFNWIW